MAADESQLKAEHAPAMANKSDDAQMKHEEEAPALRTIDRRFANGVAGTAAKILRPSEVDLYSEFLAPSPTRFSKSKIFTEYKEMHNKRNITTIMRTRDKKFFKKQLRVLQKEKKIDKRAPCWASDLQLVRKVQTIQETLLKEGILPAARTEDELRAYLRPKMDKLVVLMTTEYDKNVSRLRKQRDEAKRAERAKQQQAAASRTPAKLHGYGAENFSQRRLGVPLSPFAAGASIPLRGPLAAGSSRLHPPPLVNTGNLPGGPYCSPMKQHPIPRGQRA